MLLRGGVCVLALRLGHLARSTRGRVRRGAVRATGARLVQVVDPGLEPRHLNILAVFAVDVRGCARAAVAFALALELFLVEVDIVLFDMNDRLSEEGVRLANEGRCNLERDSTLWKVL